MPDSINFFTKKTPYKGPSADSEEKHEPVSDIDTAAADGLKVLDPKRPIREADIAGRQWDVRFSNRLPAPATPPISAMNSRRRMCPRRTAPFARLNYYVDQG